MKPNRPAVLAAERLERRIATMEAPGTRPMVLAPGLVCGTHDRAPEAALDFADQGPG